MTINAHHCPVAMRLKQARKRLGISQRNLGIAAGIDPSSSSARMNQYERGKHVPDFATLQKLASVLAVPITYFYCSDEQEANFLLNFHQLHNGQKTLVTSLVERVNFGRDQ